jgi:hypothetical protein
MGAHRTVNGKRGVAFALTLAALGAAACTSSQSEKLPPDASAAQALVELGPSVPAPPRKGSPYLICGREVVASAKDVHFQGEFRAAEEPPEVQRSRLVVRRAGSDAAVFTDEDAFHVIPGKLGTFISNSSPRLPADLPPGAYEAVWSVDDAQSNVIAFRVDPMFRVDQAPAVQIQPLQLGPGAHYDRPDLLLHLTNTGTVTVDLSEALMLSRLHLDGRPAPRAGVAWIGGSTLPAGLSWGALISFEDYRVRPSPGSHEVRLEIGGALSNPIAFRWVQPGGE